MKATGPPPVGYCVAAPDDGAEGIPPGPEVIAILPLSLDPRGFPCQPAHKALSAEGLAFFLALDHLLNLSSSQFALCGTRDWHSLAHRLPQPSQPWPGDLPR